MQLPEEVQAVFEFLQIVKTNTLPTDNSGRKEVAHRAGKINGLQIFSTSHHILMYQL